MQGKIRPGRFHWWPESSGGTWSRWVVPEGQTYALLTEGPPTPGGGDSSGPSDMGNPRFRNLQVWTFEPWEGRGPE